MRKYIRPSVRNRTLPPTLLIRLRKAELVLKELKRKQARPVVIFLNVIAAMWALEGVMWLWDQL